MHFMSGGLHAGNLRSIVTGNFDRYEKFENSQAKPLRWPVTSAL